MNNYKQTLMQPSHEYLNEEWPGRTKRRLLVIGLFISYIACLATMWYIWNAPRQVFDTFWLSFAQSRFTLISIPILLLSICYFSLRQVTGDIIGWGVKNLDERQRMVRDQAHRSAYKMIALLCLFAPLYLIIQNMLATPDFVSNLVKMQMIQRFTLYQVIKPNLYGKSLIIWHISAPAQVQSISIARNTILNQGIYYSLFLLVLALIIWTLPRAIITWKERT